MARCVIDGLVPVSTAELTEYCSINLMVLSFARMLTAWFQMALFDSCDNTNVVEIEMSKQL